MYTEDRTQIFIDSLSASLPPYLEELREEAVSLCVPLIRRQSEPLLSFFLAAHRPRRVLEIGTAIGYSALFICENAPSELQLDTIERSPDWGKRAQTNFEKYGQCSRINLLMGDAFDILPGLDPSYDMVFMDAAKGQYLSFLPEIERLIRPGGILISDNILQEGDTLLPRSFITRRDRTIHSRMREYLWEISHSSKWKSLVLSVGDGTAVSVRL